MIRPLDESAFVAVSVVMLVEIRSLYAMSDERAVRFRIIVDGTVLAPLHTGLLNRRTTFRISVSDMLLKHIQSWNRRHYMACTKGAKIQVTAQGDSEDSMMNDLAEASL